MRTEKEPVRTEKEPVRTEKEPVRTEKEPVRTEKEKMSLVVDGFCCSHPVAYRKAEAIMQERVAAIHQGRAREALWLLTHPPLYTTGTSFEASELRATGNLPIYASGRGGHTTYHDPGQRIAYVMLDLRARSLGVRCLVTAIERWIVAACGRLGVAAQTDDIVGVWHKGSQPPRKLAAIGLRVRRWVSFHGVALNVSPDLSGFEGIIPCGLTDRGVTSLAALGVHPSRAEVDRALITTFEKEIAPLRLSDRDSP